MGPEVRQGTALDPSSCLQGPDLLPGAHHRMLPGASEGQSGHHLLKYKIIEKALIFRAMGMFCQI